MGPGGGRALAHGPHGPEFVIVPPPMSAFPSLLLRTNAWDEEMGGRDFWVTHLSPGWGHGMSLLFRVPTFESPTQRLPPPLPAALPGLPCPLLLWACPKARAYLEGSVHIFSPLAASVC